MKLSLRLRSILISAIGLSHLACLSSPYFIAPQALPTLPEELAIFAGTLPPTYAFLPSPTATPEPAGIGGGAPALPTTIPVTTLPTETSAPLPILYNAQAGDTLPVVAVRFGVSVDEITSPDPLPERGLLQPGQLLVIPRRLANTTRSEQILPDSELVYSPSAADFDIEAYIAQTSGKLRSYKEWMKSTGTVSGAQVVQRVALENSINPRLLLALLEYQSGWVTGQPSEADRLLYPMGHVNPIQPALYHQLIWAVNQLSIGYYGWREGRLTELTFLKDRYRARLAPDLNAGSVALLYYFAQIHDSQGWLKAVDPQTGFPAFYRQMFGDPWERAAAVEPLYPPGLEQPPLSLPFEPNQVWSFTGGPHGAWERDGSYAALDFAPPSSEPGCVVSGAWVTASAAGLVVRSERGIVVLDLDGDGKEQTGWALVYLHVSSEDSVPVGTWVARGDRLGHPSCEGGIATGTHVHIARKFNGEWIAADGPVPFNLSGWIAVAGEEAYEGFLIRGDQVVEANTNASRKSLIMLTDADLQRE
ncbi:MAG: hypothetical protein RML93_08520 [Anaerolineales bacterium]|nr:hypothetical protein [Anaerolineales bacterium]MCS7248474.1 hypothetical protein [Anaerolineales bacterium]MDW8162287.1 hypothetical protein [Anaerolineales bacterium]MDW8447320.1 hypothetical protein [Anaerolineales bacterium]